MASNMSIKIESTEGPIEGEYLEKQGEIEVFGWSWGSTHSGTTHHGKGGGQGTLSIQDLSFTKPVDKSTPALLRMHVRGTSFKEAKLTIRKATGGDQSFDYVTITMLEGVVSGMTHGGTFGEEMMTQTITLNFPKFKYEYVAQEVAGTPGASVPMGWVIPDKKEL